MTAITPQLKDAVLSFLCENSPLEQLGQATEQDVKDLQKQFNLTFQDLNAILTYFQRCRLISDLNCRPIAIFFILRMEAKDFIRTGGFTLRETVLERNVEQLLLEIEVLKKQLKLDQLETANKISSIAGVIIGAVAAYTSTK
jgi:hypothetical protein